MNIWQVAEKLNIGLEPVRRWAATGALVPLEDEDSLGRLLFDAGLITALLPPYLRGKSFRLLTPSQAVVMAGVHGATLANWARQGICNAIVLPGPGVARRYVQREVEVQTWFPVGHTRRVEAQRIAAMLPPNLRKHFLQVVRKGKIPSVAAGAGKDPAQSLVAPMDVRRYLFQYFCLGE